MPCFQSPCQPPSGTPSPLASTAAPAGSAVASGGVPTLSQMSENADRMISGLPSPSKSRTTTPLKSLLARPSASFHRSPGSLVTAVDRTSSPKLPSGGPARSWSGAELPPHQMPKYGASLVRRSARPSPSKSANTAERVVPSALPPSSRYANVPSPLLSWVRNPASRKLSLVDWLAAPTSNGGRGLFSRVLPLPWLHRYRSSRSAEHT